MEQIDILAQKYFGGFYLEDGMSETDAWNKAYQLAELKLK